MASTTRFDDVVRTLRSAAEPTRLRVLVICAEGELTVGEIGRVLGQSQPRVSRHLKLLCEAGLLQRFREEHWVYYRVPPYGRGAEQVAQLLAWIDVSDPTFTHDRERAAEVRTDRARQAAEELQERHALEAAPGQETQIRDALLKELADGELGDLLDIGTGTGRVLHWLASRARQAIGVDLSSDALRVARSHVHSAGLSHVVLQQGDMYELAFPPASFDTITIDRVLSHARSPGAALKEAARLLRPTGRLVVIEDYDRLDAAGTVDQHPLATLRAWFAGCGLECQRLRPIETASAHLMLAVGRSPGALNAAA